MELLTLYLPWVLLMCADPYHDYKQIEQGIEINHLKHTFWAGIGYLFILAVWGWFVRPEPIAYIAHLIVVSGLRWNVHDLLLNMLRGLPLTYQGDGIKDAWTDKILKALKINPLLVKIVVLFLCILIAKLILNYEELDFSLITPDSLRTGF